MVSDLRGRYVGITEFCEVCSPTAQYRYIGKPIDAFARHAATIADLDVAFGAGSGAAWLVPELLDLSEFCGCKNKLTQDQLRDVAALLSKAYTYIKVSEFLLFFAWMKLGRYENFYGSLDPIRITSSFNQFLEDRRRYHSKIEEMLAEQRREAERRAPTKSYEQWKQSINEKGQ